MKVRELIEELQQLDPELPVYVNMEADQYGQKDFEEADGAEVEVHKVRNFSKRYNSPDAYDQYLVVKIW